ncbi:MAG: putative Mannosyltransferase [Gemmataceae bacterium]|nr:putative Mannosyltransferase [Gemmataceae bacterium]
MVTPDTCRACPFADHHFPGDGSDPAAGVRPDMPAEALADLLAGPAQAWPHGWGFWDVTHQAHRLAAGRFLGALGPYPAGRFRGRGIVIAGGGAPYFPSVYVTVRAIRHVGCALPIQVWYLGRDDELPASRRAILERFGVECVDADAVRTQYPCRILNGWELKVYAVLHSPFEEVLSLDADSYPARDPSVLFDEPGYRATGAVFWPDLPTGPPPDWRVFGIGPPGRTSIETGQFVVHKRASWQPLQLAWWYCDHSDWSFLHGYGDKGALEVAWPACGQGYTMYRDQMRWSVHSFLHVGPDGGPLFVHRCADKFRVGPSTGYLTTQRTEANWYNPDLPLEAECFEWLGELRRELAGRPGPVPARPAAPTLRAFMYTCLERRDVWEGTMARWRATDWGEDPVVVVDDGTGPTSGARHIATAHRMLLRAAEEEAEYYLLLENDLLFNLHLRQNLLAWAPLRDGWLWTGSLYNPGLPVEDTPRRAFPSQSKGGSVARVTHMFYGSQAILLSRAALVTVLREWDRESGNLDIRLGRIALRHSAGVLLHAPSLVQHMPVPSMWGGPYHRAVDFDPFFRAES